jgi:hypothetical protein
MSIYNKSTSRGSSPMNGNKPPPMPPMRRDMSTRVFTPAPEVVEKEEGEEKVAVNGGRRVGLIDPNLKLSDITRLPRSNQTTQGTRFVVPESDKVFRFQCKGTLGGDTMVAGKQVEWKATFNRPLEQLIYPSLQRFDIAKYESRVKMRQRLHGDSKAVQMHIHDSKAQYLDGDPDVHLKLEPLPDKMLPTNEAILFVHTPQWTVQITEPSLAQRGLNPDGSKPALSLTEEIDQRGERFLRNEIKDGVAKNEAARKKRSEHAADVLTGWSRRVATRELRPVALSAKEDAQVLVSYMYICICIYVYMYICI